MKTLFGLTLGGIKHKILNLVLIFLLAILLVFGAVAVFQGKKLSTVVNDTREKQQRSIRQVSEEAMHQTLEGALKKTTALQTYVADEVFTEASNDIDMLRTMAQGIFEGRSSLEKIEASLPDPKTQGTLTAQVLCEEGVDYKKSEYLGYAAYMSSVMINMVGSSGKLENCFFGLRDGTHICIDSDPESKFGSDGKLMSFPVRERPWYKLAVRTGGICFTDLESDTYTDKKVVTCAAPVYANGELIGVIGGDLSVDKIDEYVKSSLENGGFVCILSKSGRVIFAPDNNGIFTVETTETAKDLRQSENKELADFVNTAVREPTDLVTISAGGKEYYAIGKPMSSVGWTVVSIVDKKTTEAGTERMLEDYDKINDEATEKFNDASSHSIQTVLVLTLLILAFGSAAALVISGKIVKPIENMTNEIAEGGRTGKLFEMKEIYKTKDEIEVLAEAFDDLSKKTKQYIIDITQITKEKERIGTELELARKIQRDMLPNVYPAFPNRKDFDIYATMEPAKEVAGDFYDFFLIDEDHLGIVMADVSGKGIPAALFMMMSKILIHNFAMMGASPASVLEQANRTICQNNDEGMFVTVWLGILEISTGKLVASNAGHEYPIIRRGDGDYEYHKDKHSFVVGGMSGIRYSDYEIRLNKGDSLFLYTDGAPEAVNKDNRMFGAERLISALNERKDMDPVELLTDMNAVIREFAGEAEQFDDITMLELRILPPE